MEAKETNITISGTRGNPYFSAKGENDHIELKVGVEWYQILSETLKFLSYNTNLSLSELYKVARIYETSKEICRINKEKLKGIEECINHDCPL